MLYGRYMSVSFVAATHLMITEEETVDLSRKLNLQGAIDSSCTDMFIM